MVSQERVLDSLCLGGSLLLVASGRNASSPRHHHDRQSSASYYQNLWRNLKISLDQCYLLLGYGWYVSTVVSLVLFTFEMTSQIISDRGKLLAFFDSKKILLFARFLFAIGSALNAAAPSMNAFIVGKAITGIGSSGSYISIINIIAALTSPLEKGRYFGYIGFVWGLGTMLGYYLFFILLSC